MLGNHRPLTEEVRIVGRHGLDAGLSRAGAKPFPDYRPLDEDRRAWLRFSGGGRPRNGGSSAAWAVQARPGGYSSVTVESGMPVLDGMLRDRLSRRFGRGVNAWLDQLPPVLASLAQQWGLSLGPLIQRGSVSVVLWCWTAEGAAAVLKVSPDRRRINDEAAALAGWHTPKVPAVLAVDRRVGGLLIEAIKPGTALDQWGTYPRSEAVAELIAGLHHAVPPGRHD